MSEKEIKDRTKYEECAVEIHPKDVVLQDCHANGYPDTDVMVISVNKAPALGKEEESAITPESLAEIKSKGTVRYVNGEKQAALGIKNAPTTEEIKAAKAEAKRRKAEAQRQEMENGKE